MSAVERWAARLLYLVLAPFVLVGGLLADLHFAMVRVATAVCDAFGWDDPALPEVAVGGVNLAIASVGLAGLLLYADTVLGRWLGGGA